MDNIVMKNKEIKIWIQFLKEFFTAYAQNGIIYNCQEKSICWWHEKGHIERFKNQKLLSLYGHTILLGTPALFFTSDYPILFNFVALFWAFIMLGFEIDAWWYSYKHYTHEGSITKSINPVLKNEA